jgi:glutamate racemase
MKIGVFDSGFGGLTVLRELLAAVPEADYFYLGDTARLPYGSKSAATVAHYAVSSLRFLIEHGAEFLVIACNTASALAMNEMRAAVSTEIVGVIEPGAQAAAQATRTKKAWVIGTAATVASHAYEKELKKLGISAIEKACPLLVPLVEEGWTEHSVTEQVARIYFDELAQQDRGNQQRADVLVLGCTHYPLLKPLLHRIAPADMRLIDSAQSTAYEVRKRIGSRSAAQGRKPQLTFFATDSVEKFKLLGSRFLRQSVESVGLVTLPE